MKIEGDELSVFSVIVSEPRQWSATRLSEDMGFDVLETVESLKASGLVAPYCRLYPTEKGVLYAEDIGLSLGYKRPKYVNRRRVLKLYRQGVTRYSALAEALDMERAVAWFHVKKLRELGEI